VCPKIVLNPLMQPLLHLRNAESLRRLKRLAEGTEPMPDGVLPPRGRQECRFHVEKTRL